MQTQHRFRLTVFLILFLFPFGFSVQAQSPELVVQLGHSDRVRCAALSRDGKFVVTGAEDNTLKLWDVAKGQLVRTYTGHRKPIYSVALSPDGTRLYSAGEDDRLKLWDALTGKVIQDVKIDLREMTLSDDGSLVAAVCDDKEARLYDGKTLALVRTLTGGHKESLRDAAFSPDGKTLFTGDDLYKESSIVVWDIATGKQLQTINLGDTGAKRIAVNETVIAHTDGGYNFGTLVVRDRTSDKEIFKIKDDSTGFLSCDVFGTKVVCGMANGEMRFYDMSGKALQRVKVHTAFVNSVRFSADGNSVVTGSNDWSAKIFSTESGRLLRAFSTPSDDIHSISLSADGKYAALAQGNVAESHRVRVWDIKRGKLVDGFVARSDKDRLLSVAFSPRGKHLAASTFGGNSLYWSFPDNFPSGKMSVGGGDIPALAFTPNGKNIVSGNRRGDLLFWRYDRGKNETVLADSNGIASVAVSPDGKTVAAGTKHGKVHLFDYETKQRLYTAESHSIESGYRDSSFALAYGSQTSIDFGAILQNTKKKSSGNPANKPVDTPMIMRYATVMGVAFSDDGSMLAACGGSHISILDAKTLAPRKKLISTGAAFVSVSFSHNGKFLVSGGADFSVRLWDAVSGKLLHTFTGHQNEVRSVRFSAEDKFILSGSLDTQLKVWDIQKRREHLSYINLSGSNDYVITTPDGYYTATKGAAKVLAFRIGNQIFPFEQFDLKYNRPDLVLKRISEFAYGETNDHPNVPLIKSYYAAYKKRLRRLGFTEAMLGGDFHVPDVRIVSKTVPVTTSAARLTFQVEAEDDRYKLDRVNVWVNDVPVYGIGGISVKSEQTQRVSKSVEVTLHGERNKIQVSCLNEKGVESYKESAEVLYTGGAAAGVVHYIGIAVSEYQDAAFNLTYAVKDVNDLSATIKAKFPNLKLTLLTNKDATKENILKLKSQLMQTGVGDKVIISLSGHGLLDKDLDFYYATYDIDFSHPEKRGLLYDDLESILDGIPARDKLMLVDACHSGEVDKESAVLAEDTGTQDAKVKDASVKEIAARGVATIVETSQVGLENSFELMQEVFSDLARGNGAVVISAAGGKEFAFESAEWNNGVFTYAIRKGLEKKEADADGDGRVSVSELQTYTRNTVEKLTGGRQKPTSRRANLENDFKLW